MATCPDNSIALIDNLSTEIEQSVIASKREEPENEVKQQGEEEVMTSSVCKAFPEIQVMVAGLPGSGKSTALNNIFSVNFETKLSAKSVTSKVMQECKRIDKRELAFKIIDTPGLRAIDVNQKVVLHDMKNAGIKKGFLLIVTFQVYGKGAITQDFQNILKNLSTIFGVKVWDWSIILFTHSDTLSFMESTKEAGQQNYEALLHESCSVLEEELNRIGVKKKIKLFTEFEHQEDVSNKDKQTIIAMPIGRENDIDMTKRLYSCQPWTHRYPWADLVFMEIVNLSDIIPQASLKRHLLINFRYGMHVMSTKSDHIVTTGVVGSATGTIAGAFVGAAIGAFAGIPAGPGGIAIGLTAGAAIGLIAGLSTTTGAAIAGTAANHQQEIAKGRKKAK